MTDYEIIPIHESRPGDFIVVRIPVGSGDGKTGVTVTQFDDDDPKVIITGEHEIYAERPLPEVPYGLGAVLLPYSDRDDYTFVIDEEGTWRCLRNGTVVSEEVIRSFLRNGTHYVASEGIE